MFTARFQVAHAAKITRGTLGQTNRPLDSVDSPNSQTPQHPRPNYAEYDRCASGERSAMPYSAQRRVTRSPDLVAHLDLRRPLARALRRVPSRSRRSRACRRRTAATVGVVEVVGRPVGEHDVARGVDVRADVEEDLLVVVRRRRARRRRRPPSSARASRGPRSRASPCARGRGRPCGSRRSRSCGTRRRRAGRSRRSRARSPGSPAGRSARSPCRATRPRRRLADDDRRVDRVAPHRQRRHVEDRERLGRRVVAGVVAERALLGEVAAARRSPRARSPRSPAPRGRRVTPLTSSTASPRRKPANISSSMCFGSGALAL